MKIEVYLHNEDGEFECPRCKQKQKVNGGEYSPVIDDIAHCLPCAMIIFERTKNLLKACSKDEQRKTKYDFMQ